MTAGSGSGVAVVSDDLRLQFLAGLEHRHELGGDHDFRAAARVARAAGAALAHLEGAEAADLEMLASLSARQIASSRSSTMSAV